MAQLLFTALDDVTSIVEKIQGTPALLKLEFMNCACVNDDVITTICPHLNTDLLTFTAHGIHVTSNAVKIIVKRCTELQNLRFVSCVKLDSDAITYIGAHCTKLQTIAVENSDAVQSVWSSATADDVLSLLVKNCSSDLTSISFVGFKSITDIGVKYVAECYFNTLQRINFNGCSRLTDSGIIGLATSCKFLKTVFISSTAVTDFGVTALADKCPRLTQVDFSNCSKISNSSICALAKKCLNLETVNVENCHKVGDYALVSLTQNCFNLQHLNFSQTALTNIPPLVLGLRKLKSLKLNMCKTLTHPPSEVVERELSGIQDFYKEYNVAYRLKVFVMGASGVGKTSIIQSMITGKPQSASTSTEGVSTHFWQPLKGFHNDKLLARHLKTEEKPLMLELWDLSGRRVCQGVHQAFITPEALYIIVYNPLDYSSCERVPSFVNAIQVKAPASVILLVATHGEAVQGSEERARRSEEVLRPLRLAENHCVEHLKSAIASLRELDRDIKVEQRIEAFKYLLLHRPKVCEQPLYVSCSTGEGLEELQRMVVNKALSRDTYQHLGQPITPASVYLMEQIIERRNRGGVMMRWGEFIKMAAEADHERDIEDETQRLHLAGPILDMKFIDVQHTEERPARYICIHPAALHHITCMMHVDNARKSFKIEARRFWPRNNGCKKPEPSVLVKALEDIPGRGLVVESLLPILWQELSLDEEQVLLIREVLIRLGFMVPHGESLIPGPDLPLFPSLSARTWLYLPLMDKLPDKRPQLNWTPKPFKGDVQVNWRYTFPNGVPPGFMLRLVAVCRAQHTGASLPSYEHTWQCGVLYRIGEALICICSTEGRFVDLCCRVNADELGAERSSVEYLWAHLSVYILTAEQYMASWGGLFDQTTLVPLGNPFFNGDVIVNEREFCLMRCLQCSKQRQNIPFVDDQKDRYLDVALMIPYDVSEFGDVASWIRHMHSTREVVFSLVETDDVFDDVTKQATPSQRSSHSSHSSVKPSKGLDVKWDLSNLNGNNKSTTETAKVLSRKGNTQIPARRSLSPESVQQNDFIESQDTLTSLEEDCDQIQRTNGSVENVSEQKSDTGAKFNSSAVQLQKIVSNGNVQQNGVRKSESEPSQTEGLADDDIKSAKEKTADEWTDADRVSAKKCAARFVATILACAVAEYIKEQHEDNHRVQGRVTSAQVRTARLTADAAQSTYSGQMEGAAVAVLAAARGVKVAMDKQKIESYKSVRSKMCIII